VHGVEGVAELVREGRQELVLRAVRRFGRGAGLLGLPIESPDLDGGRGLIGDGHREREVGLSVAPARFGDGQGDRAQGPLVRDERRDDPGLRRELPEEREMLGVQRDRAQIGLGDARDQRRLACAHRGQRSVRRIAVEAVSRAYLEDERLLGDVDVRAGRPVKRAVRLQQIDRAEIAEDRHGQADHAGQHAFGVE
jgi:hypothetical protein